MEQWKDIPGWEGFYQANPNGTVKRLTRFVRCKGGALRAHHGGVLKAGRTGHYLSVKLVDGSRFERALVHRLICSMFNGAAPFADSQVRHLNGNPLDNRADNLAWGTALDNAGDRVLHGTDPKGERAGNSRLVDSDIIAIRAQYVKKYGSLMALAKQYGVTSTQILHIVKRRQWTHI